MQYDNLGQYIKQRRLALGKTLNEFAIENDIEPATLSRIENLKQSVKISTLNKIVEGFDKKLSEFLKDYEETR